MHDIQHLFDTEQFDVVNTLLQGRTSTPVEERFLGLSLLYTFQFEAAERPLARAAFQGDSEAQVEYGNLLRILGRHTEALQQFKTCFPFLTGELRARALRWWGVTLFSEGQHQEGLAMVKQAWEGYLGGSDLPAFARVSMTLAEMHLKAGNPRRGATLLQEVLRDLKGSADTAPQLSALKLLAELQVLQGNFKQARAYLQQGQAILLEHPSTRQEVHLLSVEADIQRLTGTDTSDALLQRLARLAHDLGEENLILWVTTRLAEWQSAHGQPGPALATLFGYPRMKPDWPLELWLTSGLLARRRGDPHAAMQDFEQAITRCREAGRTPELIRVLLHAAAAAHQLGDSARVATLLRECLTLMLHFRQFSPYAPDFEETQQLLQYAILEPEIAPYLEPLHDQIAHLINSPIGAAQNVSTLQINTFGQPSITVDGKRLELNRPGSIPLLAYLHQHPGRTRAEIQLAMFPDKSPENGAGYIRQSFQDLRQQLGRSVIELRGSARSPTYFLAPDVQVTVDLTHFWDAARERDVSRMVGLYRGPFLATAEFEGFRWVEDVRLETHAAITSELRAQIEHYQHIRDDRRAVLLMTKYLEISPDEGDILELRLQLARSCASPFEIAKYELAMRQFKN
ncbi:hypothetical protein [Deinococcus aquatilis]|uniref:hypothetical protein n=1 Tax=Deinococcus aquatilis TaxID=519440 RepID=UPI000374320F|nr:hypothetical protein [Deinococcus aquatilis]